MALPLFLSLHIAIAATVLALTIGASFYNFSGRRAKLSERTAKTQLYEDKDGIATYETQAAYSVKWQNVFATIFATAGFFVALSNAVLVTVKNQESSSIDGWLQFLPWVSGSVWYLHREMATFEHIADLALYQWCTGTDLTSFSMSSRHSVISIFRKARVLILIAGFHYISTDSNAPSTSRPRAMLQSRSFRSRFQPLGCNTVDSYGLLYEQWRISQLLVCGSYLCHHQCNTLAWWFSNLHQLS
jgi:Mor family transcriptional regulator